MISLVLVPVLVLVVGWWYKRIRSHLLVLIPLSVLWWHIPLNKVWRISEWGRWHCWECRSVCLVIRMIKLHHLIVVHRVHVLQVLLIVLSYVPIPILEMVPGPWSLGVSLSMVEWFLSISAILNQVLFSVRIVNLRSLDWHLLFFLLIVWLWTSIFNLKFLVVFGLNWLDLILFQGFSSLDVKDLFSNKLCQILKIFFWFYGIKRGFNFTEYINYKANKVFIIIANPSVKVNDFICLFEICFNDQQVTYNLDDFSDVFGGQIFNIFGFLGENNFEFVFLFVLRLNFAALLFLGLKMF